MAALVVVDVVLLNKQERTLEITHKEVTDLQIRKNYIRYGKVCVRDATILTIKDIKITVGEE